MGDEIWPPPDARVRAALWAAERHLARHEYVAAAAALGDAVAFGGTDGASVARGLRQLATAGVRHDAGDPKRAQRHLARARARLEPFLPVFEEVDLAALVALVAASLDP